MVQQIGLYCRGVCCGEVTLQESGERVEICAQMQDPGDGLYRAVLEGERGELSLGVMEPKAGALVLRRRPERSEMSRVGAVRRVRVGCAFPFGKKRVWNKTRQPTKLFRDDFFHQRLSGQSYAWWRQEQGILTVAFPWQSDVAFPLDALFCFARVERIEEELCVVFAFDTQERPISQRK